MKKCILAFVLLGLGPGALFAQVEKPNSIGVNFITLAFKNSYVYVEYERFFTEKISLGIRLGRLSYEYDESDGSYYYYEEGSGPGLGASFRYHFSENGGFMLGAGFEIVSTEWSWSEYGDFGSGSTISLAPNIQAGYRFNIGSTFFITPSLFTGYFVGVSTDTDEGPELGVYAMPAVTLGVRF